MAEVGRGLLQVARLQAYLKERRTMRRTRRKCLLIITQLYLQAVDPILARPWILVFVMNATSKQATRDAGKPLNERRPLVQVIVSIVQIDETSGDDRHWQHVRSDIMKNSK